MAAPTLGNGHQDMQDVTSPAVQLSAVFMSSLLVLRGTGNASVSTKAREKKKKNMKAAVDASAMAVEVNARKLGAPLFGGQDMSEHPTVKKRCCWIHCIAWPTVL